MNSKVNETINISESESEEGFAVGKPINEKYVIEKKLGRGGMGLTYLAYDAGDNKRKLVIKTILRKLSTPEGITAFLKEGEALGSIIHDGVVKLFDKGEDAETGLPFLVMEYVKGVPLNKIIERGQMNLRTGVEITEKIAFALNAAHGAGILHRDLKPANIMIIEDNIEGEKVKLIDFGVAKVADSVVSGGTTQFGVFKGTLQYASPEQLNGFQTESGETFTLASLTYEMLTNVRPFQITVEQKTNESDDNYNGRCYEQLKKLQKAGAKNPREYNAKIPNATAQVVLRGLSYDSSNFREGRYGTPLDYARALRESLKDEQKNIKPQPVISKNKKFFLKLLTLIGLLIFFMTAGLTGFLYWNSSNQDKASNSGIQASPTTTPQLAETLFSYSFEVQKMKNNLIEGKPFPTADKTRISTGDKFNLKIVRERGGRFYILKQNGNELNLIFPKNDSDAKSISGWHMSNSNQVFWFIWSENEIDLLEQKTLKQAEILNLLQEKQNSLEDKKTSEKVVIKGSGNPVVYKLNI